MRGLYLLSQSGEPYPVNLGNPREMTILEFAQAICRVTGFESDIRFDPCRRTTRSGGSPTSQSAATAWMATEVRLEDGLVWTLEYFRATIGVATA